MPQSTTQMRREIHEIPNAVEYLLSNGADSIANTAAKIRAAETRFMVSIARGSSDHVCTYLKYVSELLLGLPMASLGPSISSIYGANLQLNDSVCLAVSQSGKSPDIARLTETATKAGAFTIAITNDPAAPLAKVASSTLPILAGSEASVAATKTFINSLVTGLWLLAEIKQDAKLLASIHSLPAYLNEAVHCEWSAAAEAITEPSLFTLGRGICWAISNEAALKFKETCRIHAESYSSAEVLHGPVAIVERGFPVIAFAGGDAAEASLAEVADALAEKGARVFATSSLVRRATPLAHVRTDHWLTDPIATIVSFYSMVESVAVARGINPDAPRHLKKVTETI